MQQYNDLQHQIQADFILYPTTLFNRLATGDASGVKQDALNNVTQSLQTLNTQKKTVKALLGLSSGDDNAETEADTTNYEIDSVASALLKSIETGCAQNQNLFKALLPQFPQREMDYLVMGRLILNCNRVLILLCAQMLEVLEG